MRRCGRREADEEYISGAVETADENGFPLMLPDATLPVPASLMSMFAWFTPLFTARPSALPPRWPADSWYRPGNRPCTAC